MSLWKGVQLQCTLPITSQGILWLVLTLNLPGSEHWGLQFPRCLFTSLRGGRWEGSETLKATAHTTSVFICCTFCHCTQHCLHPNTANEGLPTLKHCSQLLWGELRTAFRQHRSQRIGGDEKRLQSGSSLFVSSSSDLSDYLPQHLWCHFLDSVFLASFCSWFWLRGPTPC